MIKSSLDKNYYY